MARATLVKNNLRGKLHRLVYMMNKNTRISVHTPLGASVEKYTGEGLGQGTVEGATANAVNLDNGVRDFFKDSEDEILYLGIPLGHLLFQDDVARLCLTVASAQAGNDRMMHVAKTKLLDFNLKKSCFAVFGNERRRLEMLTALSSAPLKLCGKDMVHEASIKFLGDILSEKGLADSVILIF